MANTWAMYEEKRKCDGRIRMADNADDLICRLTAEGNTPDEIVDLLRTEFEGKVSEQRIADLKSQPLAQRRIAYLKKKIAKDDFEPDTSEECIAYVKSRLVGISRSEISTRDKLSALKNLAELALQERIAKPLNVNELPTSNSALAQLMKERSE